MTGISGQVSPGFEAVIDEFERGFAARGDVGAAVAVYADGEPVVDLWGGSATAERPWQRDTVASVFSTTKGPAAATMMVLASRGVVDIDAPVSRYWPEFAQAGKAAITLRDVMTHRSGVITFPDYEELLGEEEHWGATDLIAARLAAAAPLWEPGTRHGYHALTFGWILGEVVRRTTGAGLGEVFHQEIAGPLGLDFWIGLPSSEHGRAADLIDAPPPDDPTVIALLALFTNETWTGRAHFVGPDGIGAVADTFNSPAVRSAEIPAGGGIGTARSLARMYGALAIGGALDGVDLVDAATIAAFTAEQVRGLDGVLMLETRYGTGFARPTVTAYYGPNDAAFGHGGLGGSLAFADPKAGIGFAYVPRQLQYPSPMQVTRAGALINALYAVVP